MAPPFTYTNESRTKGRVPEKHVCMYVCIPTILAHTCPSTHAQPQILRYAPVRMSTANILLSTRSQAHKDVPWFYLEQPRPQTEKGVCWGLWGKEAEKSLHNRQRFGFED